jgi:hypothetical protein
MSFDKFTGGLQIGSNKDCVRITRQGEVQYRGLASTWEDIQTSLIGRQLSSPAGAVDYNYAENTITMKPNGVISNVNDCVSWNIQYPHKARVDGSFNVHLHWEQVDSTPRQFTLWYRKQPLGAAKATAWVPVVVNTGAATNAFPYVSGTLNQITRLVSIDMTGAGLSCIVQFRLTRSDAVAGNIEAQFADAHYEIDSTGSAEEYRK